MSSSSADPDACLPARWIESDLILAVHAQPGARRTEVAGLHDGALKVRLRARAISGAANEALLEFLASELQVARRQVVLIAGERSRQKRVRIERPHRDLALERLREWGVPLQKDSGTPI